MEPKQDWAGVVTLLVVCITIVVVCGLCAWMNVAGK